MCDRAFTYLGTTDEVSTCDCCGKSNLQSTVAFEVDDTVMYYGSSCAVRHTGRKLAAWESVKRAADAAAKAAVELQVKQSAEWHALQGKTAQRTVAKLSPGRAARDYLEPELSAFKAREAAIWAAAGVKKYS